MSSCNDYAEFLATLCLETGARPHQVAPLARRLRRLATTHARRCETACNGCRRCDGYSPRAGVWIAPTHPPTTEEDRERCPQCSTDTVERAIEATCDELVALWRQFADPRVICDWEADPRNRTAHAFAPTFQGDPRGATVRLRVPSGASGDWGGVVVPTSRA